MKSTRKKTGGAQSARPAHSGVSFPVLALAAAARQETGRRWASKRRRALESRIEEIRSAKAKGLSIAEIRELLERDGMKVGRWMLYDVLRGLTKKPNGKKAVP